jgi:hypothetical protein
MMENYIILKLKKKIHFFLKKNYLFPHVRPPKQAYHQTKQFTTLGAPTTWVTHNHHNNFWTLQQHQNKKRKLRGVYSTLLQQENKEHKQYARTLRDAKF